MQCPECGSNDLYFFHEYRFNTFLYFIVVLFSSLLFDFLLRVLFVYFQIELSRLWFSIPFGLFLFILFIYLYVSAHRHPRLHVICKSCGYDWIAF